MTTDPFATPDAVAPGAAAAQLTPPQPEDTKPKRPTTRAGRAAAAAARQAKNGGAPKADSKPKSQKSPAPRKADLENRITAQLAFIGTGIAGAGAISGKQALQLDGVLLIEHAPNLSAALKNLGDQNPKVKAYMEAALGASAWGGLLAAMLPLVLGIGANHGMVSPEIYLQMTGAMAAMATPPIDGGAE